jgi:hypothetical protein
MVLIFRFAVGPSFGLTLGWFRIRHAKVSIMAGELPQPSQ